ncbi:MAG: VOC family protein [Thermoleophilaceae bacterium]|nr:VOC family protein [Thermoleophilaceae bacterium]
MSPQITPFIWIDADPREARDYYFSIFDDTAEVFAMPGPGEAPMGIAISIDGNPYILFNGGPGHPQTDAFSLMVSAEGQDEVDRYWDGLTADGEEGQCGWLKDKYGVSWQIVPTMLPDVMGGPDPEGRARASQAMMGMKKLIIADLQAAYDGTA